MKRLLLSLIGMLCLGFATGCCCTSGCGPGGCGYNPLSPYGGAAPYGAGTVIAPASAYYPATNVQAGIPIPMSYAANPVQVLRTY